VLRGIRHQDEQAQQSKEEQSPLLLFCLFSVFDRLIKIFDVLAFRKSQH
jgi:hypothetical protein